jgi:hypothetical protein
LALDADEFSHQTRGHTLRTELAARKRVEARYGRHALLKNKLSVISSTDGQ